MSPANMLYQVISLLILLSGVGAPPGFINTPQARLSLRMGHQEDCFEKVENIVVDVFFTNDSNGTVWLVDIADLEHSSFEISVIDPHDKQIPRRERKRIVDNDDRHIWSVKPGGKSEHPHKIFLNDIFAFNDPGTYKIQISRIYYLEELHPNESGFFKSLKAKKSAKCCGC